MGLSWCDSELVISLLQKKQKWADSGFRFDEYFVTMNEVLTANGLSNFKFWDRSSLTRVYSQGILIELTINLSFFHDNFSLIIVLIRNKFLFCFFLEVSSIFLISLLQPRLFFIVVTYNGVVIISISLSVDRKITFTKQCKVNLR